MILWITARAGRESVDQSEEPEAAGAGVDELEDDVDDVVEELEELDEDEPERESVR
ncbi:hypothetical protein GCM10010197_40800 [Nocardioides luteus]|uniref:Uncharacterized protein n=1 Tax=Nocardioides luteus TaxID=1844 RepID=A0ABQ5SZE4_9ACTN|nr:hypothetical protein GCM10010197_40800 [Nocardioides luteus]GLJ69216.1 hypothetical protein GCM10017579_32520 [Nocardioides luteus]